MVQTMLSIYRPIQTPQDRSTFSPSRQKALGFSHLICFCIVFVDYSSTHLTLAYEEDHPYARVCNPSIHRTSRSTYHH